MFVMLPVLSVLNVLDMLSKLYPDLPSSLPEEQMAESLRVFLHGACNLPPARQGGYQPYCVLCITPQEVEQQIKYTSIQSSANPIWRSSMRA